MLVLNDMETNMLAARKDPEMDTIQFETRLTRVEVSVEHMSSGISEMKGQLLDLRTSMDARFEVVNQKFDVVNQKFDAINDKFGDTNEKFGRAIQRLEDGTNQKFAEVNPEIRCAVDRDGRQARPADRKDGRDQGLDSHRCWVAD